MCEAIGGKVLALHRSKIAGIGVKEIPLGKWRYLSKTEVEKILKGNIAKQITNIYNSNKRKIKGENNK